MKKIRKLSLIIVCFSFFACGPVIQDHTVRSPASFGASWYHEGKSPEEMEHDYNECEFQQRQNDNDPFVKSDCMKQKGYVLK